MSVLESMLTELEERCCDLRCRNVPTGGGDFDVEWFVIEHYEADPREREIGSGRDPTEAMLVAFHGVNSDDLVESRVAMEEDQNGQ